MARKPPTTCGVALPRRPFTALPPAAPRKAPARRPGVRPAPEPRAKAPEVAQARPRALLGLPAPAAAHPRSTLPPFPGARARGPLAHLVGTPRAERPQEPVALPVPRKRWQATGGRPGYGTPKPAVWTGPEQALRVFESLSEQGNFSPFAHLPDGIRLPPGHVTTHSPGVAFTPRLLAEMGLGRLLARGVTARGLDSALSGICEDFAKMFARAKGRAGRIEMYLWLLPEHDYGATSVVAEMVNGELIVDSADAAADDRMGGKKVSLRDAILSTGQRPAEAWVTVNGRPIAVKRNVLRLIAPAVIAYKSAGRSADEIVSMFRRSMRFMLVERGQRIGGSAFAGNDTRHGLLGFVEMYPGRVQVRARSKSVVLEADEPKRLEDRPSPPWQAPRGLAVTEVVLDAKYLREMVTAMRATGVVGLDFVPLRNGDPVANGLTDAVGVACHRIFSVFAGAVKRAGPPFSVNDERVLKRIVSLAKSAKGTVNIRHDFDAASVAFTFSDGATEHARAVRATSQFRPSYQVAVDPSLPKLDMASALDRLSVIAESASDDPTDPTRDRLRVVRLLTDYGHGPVFAQATNGMMAVNVKVADHAPPFDGFVSSDAISLTSALVPRSKSAQARLRERVRLVVIGSGRVNLGHFSFFMGHDFCVFSAAPDGAVWSFPDLSGVLGGVSPANAENAAGEICDAGRLRSLIDFLEKKSCSALQDGIRRAVVQVRRGKASVSCQKGDGRFDGFDGDVKSTSDALAWVDIDRLVAALRALATLVDPRKQGVPVTMTVGPSMAPVGFIFGPSEGRMTSANVAAISPMSQKV